MDWQVLEDEWDARPEQEEAQAPPRPARWRRRVAWLFALVALAASLSAGVVAWRVREQETQLRADLVAVMDAELRSQSFGLDDEIPRFADPDAPEAWQEQYRRLWEARPTFSSTFLFFGFQSWAADDLPAIRAVTLADDGQRAVVEVGWPANAAVAQQRAYRLVGGRWRRTPLVAEHDSETAITRRVNPRLAVWGQPSDFAPLLEDDRLRLEGDGFRQQLLDHWGDALMREGALTVTLQPQEFAGPIADSFSPFEANEYGVQVNAPALAVTFPEMPLSSRSQYNLAVTSAMAYTLIDWQPWFEQFDQADDTAFMLFLSLPQAEARRWVLDADERRTLRNWWRAEMGGEWSSILSFPVGPDNPGNEAGERAFIEDEVRPYVLRWHLFTEFLVERGYIQSPGHLAQEIDRQPMMDTTVLLAALTGRSWRDLEAEARDYVLTPEPPPN